MLCFWKDKFRLHAGSSEFAFVRAVRAFGRTNCHHFEKKPASWERCYLERRERRGRSQERESNAEFALKGQ